MDDWEVAGYLPLGADFTEGYVDLEGVTTDDWSFIETADYVVIHFDDLDGVEDYFTTIVGPFDDYDDLVEAIAEWYEQGS